jgi:hypothetical protein
MLNRCAVATPSFRALERIPWSCSRNYQSWGCAVSLSNSLLPSLVSSDQDTWSSFQVSDLLRSLVVFFGYLLLPP